MDDSVIRECFTSILLANFTYNTERYILHDAIFRKICKMSGIDNNRAPYFVSDRGRSIAEGKGEYYEKKKLNWIEF